MDSPIDTPAPSEPADPADGPRCVLCDEPLSTYLDCLCYRCADELDRASRAEAAEALCARDTWAPGEHIPRGLPRPIYKGRPVPWAELEERITPFGDELDSHTAQNDERLDDCFWETPLQDMARLGEAWENDLCVLCGEPLGEEVHFFTEDWQTLAQGGLHPRCGRLTRAHCPGVNDHGWTLASAPRPAWDELRQATPGLGWDSGMEARLPEEYEPVPERMGRARTPLTPPPTTTARPAEAERRRPAMDWSEWA
jgi:hypothetical protein